MRWCFAEIDDLWATLTCELPGLEFVVAFGDGIEPTRAWWRVNGSLLGFVVTGIA
jgi:hypothetical protein